MDLLDKMATYVRVIEAGGFSAAAKQLRISPGAVSRQISTLEAGLRVRLLLRSTRRMTITADGRRYYERCLRILRDVDEAQGIGRQGSLEGLLHVNAPVTFGLARVVPHLHAFTAAHPALRFNLDLDDRLIDVAREGVDMVIRVGSPPPNSVELVAQLLLSYRRVLVASPAYLKRRGEPKTPEALVKHDALAYAAGSANDSWRLLAADRDVQVHVNVVFRTNALHALRGLAIAGSGVALLPDWLVADAVAQRDLRVILPAWQSDLVHVNALFRTGQRGAHGVRAFVEHLRIAYAEPAGRRREPV